MLYNLKKEQTTLRKTKQLAKNLDKTLNLIEHGWCQGSFNHEHTDGRDLVCLVVAVKRSCPRGSIRATYEALDNAIPRASNNSRRYKHPKSIGALRVNLTGYNDAWNTSATNIMDLVKRARSTVLV